MGCGALEIEYNGDAASVTVTVSPAEADVPTGLTATYGQTLADVKLPDGWTWAADTESVGKADNPAVITETAEVLSGYEKILHCSPGKNGMSFKQEC